MFKRVTGFKDILPQEALLWQAIEEKAREVFSVYNYQEIRLPILEEAALFDRSLGESSEIVQKQMFMIKNKEELYALRPEATASIVRSYIENNLDKNPGFIKLYYIGAMFRLERPQKGRLRQFNHIGVEAIGSLEPMLDVEVISLADTLLKEFSISGFNIKINSLGCAKDKKSFSESLHQALKGKLDSLCDDCQVRFKTNTLRILDCKNEACQEIVKSCAVYKDCLCDDCALHFKKVLQGLDKLEINYEVCPTLVRGLDYYTGTVFEIAHRNLGSQDALGAGGRYNNLVHELGGPEEGAMGFAFGVERLMLVTDLKLKALEEGLVYLIGLGAPAQDEAIKLLHDLRSARIPCDTDYESRSLKAAMRKANDLGVKFVLILGDDELKKGTVTLKNMSTGEQKEVTRTELIKEIKC